MVEDRVQLPDSVSPALAEYVDAFIGDAEEEPFVAYFPVGHKDAGPRALTRGDLWRLACRAAKLLKNDLGLRKGDTQVHFFTGNSVEDLALRLAAVFIGTVPVTINWDSDPVDRIVYKVTSSAAKVVFIQANKTPADQVPVSVDAVKAAAPSVKVIAIDEALAAGGTGARDMLAVTDFESDLKEEDIRIIIYTSGSSGEPKGVKLPYRSYRTNRLTFESFLQVGPDSTMTAVIVNPMHHTNSTAFTDWCLRRPGSRLFLFERYTTPYWATLVSAALGLPSPQGLADLSLDRIEELASERVLAGVRILAPTVSRHFDFLEALAKEPGTLKLSPLHPQALKLCAPLIDFIVGSAPVGPHTVERFQTYLGKLPTVRFGSTETCLQVMGTPLGQGDDAKLQAFKRGWEAKGQPGFYIGRPHPPFTEVMVVRGIDRGDRETYLKETDEGETGYCVTRGRNLMSGYVNAEQKTTAVIDVDAGGWYTNLGDVCFWLRSSTDGGNDYYWVSRTSNLLIKGGANYSYEQLSNELTRFVESEYGLSAGRGDFSLAAVGLRVSSEHDDDVLVTVELSEDAAARVTTTLESTFVSRARGMVSKGAKPDHVRLAPIPRNFKGDVNWRSIESQWAEDFKQKGASK